MISTRSFFRHYGASSCGTIPPCSSGIYHSTTFSQLVSKVLVLPLSWHAASTSLIALQQPLEPASHHLTKHPQAGALTGTIKLVFVGLHMQPFLSLFFSSSTAFTGDGLHLTHHALLTRGLEATMILGTRRRLVAASTYDRTMPGLAKAKANAKCRMRMSNLVSRLRWDTRWASSARLGLTEMESKPFPSSSSSSSTGSLFLSQPFHFRGGTLLFFSDRASRSRNEM